MERRAISSHRQFQRGSLKQDLRQHVKWMAPLILVVATASILVAETHEVKLERDVPAKMRDGAILYALRRHPPAKGRRNVFRPIERTPYNK